MAQLIKSPSIIKAAGTVEKLIQEFFGNINSQNSGISIARMTSPYGWEEPGQCPEFDEYTIMLKGNLKIKTKTEEFIVTEGQAIMIPKNEWVQYSSPFCDGAEYIAICVPAFSPNLVHRDHE
jgi:mannose-6-phosphate isomerase-like protein (cupin superfamily)